MKKILSIIGTISLITRGSSNLIACDNKNINYTNNKKNKKAKVTIFPNKKNWEFINTDNWENEFSTLNKNNIKTYLFIYFSKYMDENKFIEDIKKISWAHVINFTGDTSISIGDGGLYVNPLVYRWNGKIKPILPKINEDTGEIIEW